MRFAFKAIDEAGGLVSGTIAAHSLALARDEIVSQRLTPLLLREKSSRLPTWLSRPIGFRDRLTIRDVAALTRTLAALLKAGLTLDRALSIVATTSEHSAIRALCTDLSRRVREGSSFADALTGHSRLFPPYSITIIRAGELGGTLDEGLLRLSQLAERVAQTRERIGAALIYP